MAYTDDDPRRSELLLPLRIRSKPLFQKMNIILDFCTENYHYTPTLEAANKYLFGEQGYSAIELIKELGGQTFVQYLSTDQEASNLVRLLTRLYNIKGTNTGMELMLDIIGLKGEIIDWFEVQRNIDNWTPQGQLWAADSVLAGLQNCEYMIDLTVNPGPEIGLQLDNKVRDLARLLMWTCAKLAVIRYKVGVEDVYNFVINEEIEILQEYSTSNWYFNLGTCIQIGNDPDITLGSGNIICDDIDLSGCLLFGSFSFGPSNPLICVEEQVPCPQIGEWTIGADAATSITICGLDAIACQLIGTGTLNDGTLICGVLGGQDTEGELTAINRSIFDEVLIETTYQVTEGFCPNIDQCLIGYFNVGNLLICDDVVPLVGDGHLVGDGTTAGSYTTVFVPDQGAFCTNAISDDITYSVEFLVPPAVPQPPVMFAVASGTGTATVPLVDGGVYVYEEDSTAASGNDYGAKKITAFTANTVLPDPVENNYIKATNGVTFSPDKQYIAYGQSYRYGNARVFVHRTSDWQQVFSYTMPWSWNSQINALSFSPDNSMLFVGAANNSGNNPDPSAVPMLLFEVGTWLDITPAWNMGTRNVLVMEDADWSPDGTMLAVACSCSTSGSGEPSKRYWAVFETSTWSRISPDFVDNTGAIVLQVKFSNDSQYLYVGGQRSSVVPTYNHVRKYLVPNFLTFTTPEQELRFVDSQAGSVHALDMNPEGTRLLVGGGYNSGPQLDVLDITDVDEWQHVSDEYTPRNDWFNPLGGAPGDIGRITSAGFSESNDLVIAHKDGTPGFESVSVYDSWPLGSQDIWGIKALVEVPTPIQDLAVYKPLSQTQVVRDYDALALSMSPVTYHPFVGKTLDNMKLDSVATGGVLNITEVEGQVAYSRNFVSLADTLQEARFFSLAASNKLAALTTLTLNFWIRPRSYFTVSNPADKLDQDIFGIAEIGGDTAVFNGLLLWHRPDNSFGIRMGTGLGTGTTNERVWYTEPGTGLEQDQQTAINALLTTAKWRMVTVQIETVGGLPTCKVWVDATLVSTPTSAVGSANVLGLAGDNRVLLGKPYGSSTVAIPVKNISADFKRMSIMGSALTEQQLQDLYEEGK